MSWPALACTLGLCLLTSRVNGVTLRSNTVQEEDNDVAWWYPVAGVLKVYDLNNDLFTDLAAPAAAAEPKITQGPPHRLAGHERVSLLSLGESTVETRVHDGAAKAVGSGSGTGNATAAAKKVAINASTVDAATTAIRGKGNTAKITPVAALSWFAWLRVTFSMGFVVKSLCMILNIFYQASPLQVISQFRDKGDTADSDLAPFICLAYSGWQWCFYGMFAYIVTGKSGFLVLVYSNVVGATLGLYYVYAFLSISKNTKMIEKSTKYYYVLGCVVAVQVIALLSQTPVRALFFSGLISSTWSTVTSFSLLATVPIVYETQNSKSLPLPLLVMGWLCSVIWSTCGLMLWDPWITFPNAIALFICTYALHLCYKFPPKDCAEDYPKGSPRQLRADDCGHHPDVEHASPLQRAISILDLVTGSAAHRENQPLQDPDTTVYGTVAGGTGGTGDSF